MFAIVIVALWLGSAVAGWLWFWPWLIAPAVDYGLYASKATARYRAAEAKHGLSRDVRSTAMLHRANFDLVAKALLQHILIFGAAAGVHWLLG